MKLNSLFYTSISFLSYNWSVGKKPIYSLSILLLKEGNDGWRGGELAIMQPYRGEPVRWAIQTFQVSNEDEGEVC